MIIGILSATFAALLGLSLAFLLKHFSHGRRNPSNLPLGHMGLPFVGESLAFLKPHKSHSMGSFLDEHCSRYGRVFKSHLFGSPAIVSCDHELNMFILQNEEKLFECSYPKAIHGILGKFSLLVVSGHLHKKLRNIAINFINSSRATSKTLDSIEKLTISMMESWKDCKQIIFYTEAKKFAINLMVKYLLSIGPEEPAATKILEDFETYMKGFVSLPIYIPGNPYTKAVKARERLSSTVREIMEARKVNVGMKNGDFLDVILSRAHTLKDEEIVSIVLDILLGGYETTATLMSLIVYFVGQSPIALQKLKEEHREIRKSKENGDPLNWEDYKKMEFTSNVICEALRCGNVVKFVHRKAIQDVKFKEIFIPSGWKVLPVFTAAHFDPNLHENPLEFNPWRWSDKTLNKKVSSFGGGLRLCPGAELAKIEIALFLHHLVRNYSWKTNGDDYPIAYPYVKFKRDLILEIQPMKK